MTDLMRNNYIRSCLQEHYNEALTLGYEVVGIFLQGSQNYDCDLYTENYMSDVDTKAIILPAFNDIIQNKPPVSFTHIRANNEHIDIKDIRLMFELFKKQNSSYLEILFTEFRIINPKYELLVNELLKQAENIARLHFNQALRCFSGMSSEKLKALEHPYPTIKDKIDKYGYDPKQLHHIVRINDFIKRYIAGEPFNSCLKPSNTEYLTKLKLGTLSLEDARALAVSTDLETKRLVTLNNISNEYVNKEMLEFLDNLKIKFIRQFSVEDLQTNG